MTREEDIDDALAKFDVAIEALQEIRDIFRGYHIHEFEINRVYDYAGNTAQALTYTRGRLHKEKDATTD